LESLQNYTLVRERTKERSCLVTYDFYMYRTKTGFDSRQGQEIFLYPAQFLPAPGPTHPPIKWIAGPVFPGVKRSGREADHSPPSNAEVKNDGAIPQLPHTS
jgi:hypothetical protein